LHVDAVPKEPGGRNVQRERSERDVRHTGKTAGLSPWGFCARLGHDGKTPRVWMHGERSGCGNAVLWTDCLDRPMRLQERCRRLVSPSTTRPRKNARGVCDLSGRVPARLAKRVKSGPHNPGQASDLSFRPCGAHPVPFHPKTTTAAIVVRSATA